MKNGDMPASPVQSAADYQASGLTKRELFAAMAMQGLVPGIGPNYDYDRVAGLAVGYADALLAELEKQP